MELTKFDKCLLSVFYSVAEKAVMIIGTASFQEDVNEWSKTLLNLARKELQPEFEKELDKAYKTADNVQYQKGKQDALKDLLKWKRAKFDSNQKARICLSSEDMNYPHYTNCIKKGEYYIDFEDLKTLPKEE